MTLFFNVKEITSTFCFTDVLFFGLEINCHRLYRMKKYLDHSLGLFAWPCVDPKTASNRIFMFNYRETERFSHVV